MMVHILTLFTNVLHAQKVNLLVIFQEKDSLLA